MIHLRVVVRHRIRQAVQKLFAKKSSHKYASHGWDQKTVVAFAENMLLYPAPNIKISSGGIFRKLKEILSFFQKAPRVWDLFKKKIGISSLSEIPGKIRDLAKKGLDVLRHAIDKVFSIWPLKIYVLPHLKLSGFVDLLANLTKRYPALERFFKQKVRPAADQFDKWIRKYLPVISTILLAGIFIWIWLNVVEFEWDIKALADVLVGRLTLGDLLLSLPSSGVGFLMNALHLGTFTLLPITIAARFLFLMGHRYLTWTGRGFHFEWDLLKEDVGIEGAVGEPAVVTI